MKVTKIFLTIYRTCLFTQIVTLAPHHDLEQTPAVLVGHYRNNKLCPTRNVAPAGPIYDSFMGKLPELRYEHLASIPYFRRGYVVSEWNRDSFRKKREGFTNLKFLFVWIYLHVCGNFSSLLTLK